LRQKPEYKRLCGIIQAYKHATTNPEYKRLSCAQEYQAPLVLAKVSAMAYSRVSVTSSSTECVVIGVGVPASTVFKTLVVVADGERRLLVMAPGDRELELRVVARSVGAKSAHMAPQREAERLTGLKVGGISPLALLDKRFEIYLDESASGLEELCVNGGQRGVNIRLRMDDLLAVTGARLIAATASAAAG
jgi:Cys-tRNA(Pro)/Cys-tRNA(Cys) deacylase